MKAKSAAAALAASISSAWERGSPRIEDPTMPKSIERANLCLGKTVIRRTLVYRFGLHRLRGTAKNPGSVKYRWPESHVQEIRMHGLNGVRTAPRPTGEGK